MKITHPAYEDANTYGECTRQQFEQVWEPKGYKVVSDEQAEKMLGPEDVAKMGPPPDVDALDGEALREYARSVGVSVTDRMKDETVRTKILEATEPGAEPGPAES